MKNNWWKFRKYTSPSSKGSCPQCGHKGVFSVIVNTATNEPIGECGRCDRENSCGYILLPQKEDRPEASHFPTDKKGEIKSIPIVQYLPFEVLEKSVAAFTKSNLYPFLGSLFTSSKAVALSEDYFIGASKNGNTAFLQVDIDGRIRQVKVIEYLPTGKRNKKTGAVFMGKKILNDNEASLKQCFYGEYLLSFDPSKEKGVAIVESEKTAIIASVYFPEHIWLATGGSNGCKWTERDVCKVLSGRRVTLFPDLGLYETWKDKGRLIANVANCNVHTSDFLERIATEEERINGLDIADYLLRNRDSSGLALSEAGYPLFWD